MYVHMLINLTFVFCLGNLNFITLPTAPYRTKVAILLVQFSGRA